VFVWWGHSMRTPTRIAGRETVFEFLRHKLRAYPFIYIDFNSNNNDNNNNPRHYEDAVLTASLHPIPLVFPPLHHTCLHCETNNVDVLTTENQTISPTHVSSKTTVINL